MVKLVWPGGRHSAPIVDFRRAVGRMEIQSGKFECRAEGGRLPVHRAAASATARACASTAAAAWREAGRLYREILMHYYRNCAIGKLY